jgi:hypothetical protein
VIWAYRRRYLESCQRLTAPSLELLLSILHAEHRFLSSQICTTKAAARFPEKAARLTNNATICYRLYGNSEFAGHLQHAPYILGLRMPLLLSVCSRLYLRNTPKAFQQPAAAIVLPDQ